MNGTTVVFVSEANEGSSELVSDDGSGVNRLGRGVAVAVAVQSRRLKGVARSAKADDARTAGEAKDCSESPESRGREAFEVSTDSNPAFHTE